MEDWEKEIVEVPAGKEDDWEKDVVVVPPPKPAERQIGPWETLAANLAQGATPWSDEAGAGIQTGLAGMVNATKPENRTASNWLGIDTRYPMDVDQVAKDALKENRETLELSRKQRPKLSALASTAGNVAGQGALAVGTGGASLTPVGQAALQGVQAYGASTEDQSAEQIAKDVARQAAMGGLLAGAAQVAPVITGGALAVEGAAQALNSNASEYDRASGALNSFLAGSGAVAGRRQSTRARKVSDYDAVSQRAVDEALIKPKASAEAAREGVRVLEEQRPYELLSDLAKDVTKKETKLAGLPASKAARQETLETRARNAQAGLEDKRNTLADQTRELSEKAKAGNRQFEREQNVEFKKDLRARGREIQDLLDAEKAQKAEQAGAGKKVSASEEAVAGLEASEKGYLGREVQKQNARVSEYVKEIETDRQLPLDQRKYSPEQHAEYDRLIAQKEATAGNVLEPQGTAAEIAAREYAGDKTKTAAQLEADRLAQAEILKKPLSAYQRAQKAPTLVPPEEAVALGRGTYGLSIADVENLYSFLRAGKKFPVQKPPLDPNIPANAPELAGLNTKIARNADLAKRLEERAKTPTTDPNYQKILAKEQVLQRELALARQAQENPSLNPKIRALIDEIEAAKKEAGVASEFATPGAALERGKQKLQAFKDESADQRGGIRKPLEFLAKGTLGKAADLAGVGKPSALESRKRNPEFRAAYYAELANNLRAKPNLQKYAQVAEIAAGNPEAEKALQYFILKDPNLGAVAENIGRAFEKMVPSGR